MNLLKKRTTPPTGGWETPDRSRSYSLPNVDLGLWFREEDDGGHSLRLTVANRGHDRQFHANVDGSIGLHGYYEDLNWPIRWDQPTAPGWNGHEHHCPIAKGDWASAGLMKIGPGRSPVCGDRGSILPDCTIPAYTHEDWPVHLRFEDPERHTPVVMTNGRCLLKVGVWDQTGNNLARRTVAVLYQGPTAWFMDDAHDFRAVWAYQSVGTDGRRLRS